MKKIIKSRMFIVVICGILFISLGVYGATKYKASEVIYNTSSGETMNVNEALNEIYNIKTLGDATSEDILEGKTAIVQGKMITGTAEVNSSTISLITSSSDSYDKTISGNKTIDCKSIDGYEQLTVNNFIVETTSAFYGNYAGQGMGTWANYNGLSKTYNAQTGILTVSWSFKGNGWDTSATYFQTRIGFRVYLVQ